MQFSPSIVEGFVDGYVKMTLDDVSGINATAAFSPNAKDELLSGEGTNEENPEATLKKVFLPVISGRASGTVNSESADNLSMPGE